MLSFVCTKTNESKLVKQEASCTVTLPPTVLVSWRFNLSLSVSILQTNLTAKRQQDSEANETHLEGYSGNVRFHKNHVDFGSGAGDKKIILPDIEKADREFFAVGPPKIMDQTLGPCTPPGIELCNQKLRNRFLFSMTNG